MDRVSGRNRKSWVELANGEGGFPLQNLPFCAFQVRGGGRHLGVGIGDSILDIARLAQSEAMSGVSVEVREACMEPTLNRLMACGGAKTLKLRGALMRMLAEDVPQSTVEKLKHLLQPMSAAQFCLPVAIGDYTDFYASIHHATNVGKLFRPDEPLMPNYKFVPIGYHGRASSIVISGTAVKRPNGQTKSASADAPTFGPSRQMDYELELGAYIGTGNSPGSPIDVDRAEQHIFGVSLVNDWSARDIQAWEYQPLGPFLGKSFATSVSPWVVTMDALTPYRVPLAARIDGDPQPLPYLAPRSNTELGIDIELEVFLTTQKMREAALNPLRLSSVSAKELYWSFAQMVAHHTSNGCNLRTGDLLASGTISGPGPESQGSLLEITRRGAEPLKLPSGEDRSFLEDGDEITFRGFCEREGLPRVSLGECKGMIIPATLSSRAAV
ncbi:MAG TPA: fumarylacetoacetase [Acidobacteriaceae bacterium]|nr:fumarylacetoacetase [Acidobacteriaceae bacterium]